MTATDTGLRCSFCGKEAAAVAKVIAGPGVYICDECVQLCVDILAADAADPAGAGEQPRLPMWESMSDDDMLAHIPKIALTAGRVEDGLRDWVLELRRRGVTWQRVGSALGTTRQSAWERFSGEE